MRGLGRLLALLFLLLLVATGVVFYYQRLAAEANATPPPTPLPENVAGTADRWQWSHTVEGRPMVEVSARSYRMIQMPSRVELEDVELKIFGGQTDTYDLVKSRRADVDTRAKTMVSEGEVEIVMQLPTNGGPPPARPTVIRSSKVQFETESGIARTAEKTFFQFADGHGEATGAVYNPQTKEIILDRDAVFTFQRPDRPGVATRVEAAHALFLEAAGLLQLSGPTVLVRANLRMDAGDATVTLSNGEVSRVEAVNVSGVDAYPNRKLAFGGDRVEMLYREDGTLREVISNAGSRLDSESSTVRNTVRAPRMHLMFREGSPDASLEKALAQGGARLDSVPMGKAATSQPRRRLEADMVELQMRAGADEIEQFLTHSPGVLSFFPATPEQRQRVLRAERMRAEYGPENRIRQFRATKTVTESAPSAAQLQEAKRRNLPVPEPLRTKSADLEAMFHPETGEVQWMKQWGAFEFEEGVRRGRAETALLHQQDKYNLLEGQARVWDDTGSLAAQRIRTEEPSGDLVAEGNVVSTRKPERQDKTKPKGKGSDPLLPGGDEALQATAARMTTRDQNQWIRYEGNARLWQGANRLHADAVVIDRKQQTIEAKGNVFSQIEEAASTGAAKAAASPDKTKAGGASTARKAAPVYTLIHSEQMRYQEADKLATYTGNVRMRRAGLSVDSTSMRMVLAEDEAGQTMLRQSFADGDVRILMREATTTRRGGAEHAEYEPAQTKMVLYGGDPFFEDQRQGATRGMRLTYYSKDDRLLVESGETAPALSVIRRN